MLSSPPPADVSTFLAFPSPEKLLRLGPKSSALIAQQVTAFLTPNLPAPWLLELPEQRDKQRGIGRGRCQFRVQGRCQVAFF